MNDQWSAMPEQQHQAFANAAIGIYPSSTGEGGRISVYDNTATKGAIAGAAYWNKAVRDGLTARKRRTYDAILDLVKKQADDTGANGGISMDIIGSDGAPNVPARITTSGAYPDEVLSPALGS